MTPLRNLKSGDGNPLPKARTRAAPEVHRSGGSDLGGKQSWRPQHKEMSAAPKFFPALKSLRGTLQGADLL